MAPNAAAVAAWLLALGMSADAKPGEVVELSELGDTALNRTNVGLSAAEMANASDFSGWQPNVPGASGIRPARDADNHVRLAMAEGETASAEWRSTEQEAMRREDAKMEARQREANVIGRNCSAALCNYLLRRLVGVPKDAAGAREYAAGKSPLSYNGSIDNTSINVFENARTMSIYQRSVEYHANELAREQAAQQELVMDDNKNSVQRMVAGVENLPPSSSPEAEQGFAEIEDWAKYKASVDAAAQEPGANSEPYPGPYALKRSEYNSTNTWYDSNYTGPDASTIRDLGEGAGQDPDPNPMNADTPEAEKERAKLVEEQNAENAALLMSQEQGFQTNFTADTKAREKLLRQQQLKLHKEVNLTAGPQWTSNITEDTPIPYQHSSNSTVDTNFSGRNFSEVSTLAEKYHAEMKAATLSENQKRTDKVVEEQAEWTALAQEDLKRRMANCGCPVSEL